MSRPFQPDPKAAPRIIDPKAGRAKVLAEGRCRVCGDRAGYHGRRYVAPGQIEYQRYVKLSRHHLVPRSQGGDDVDPNLVPTCGDGTTGCHGLLEAMDRAARARLRANLRAEEIEYVIEKRGEGWFDRHYPTTANDSRRLSR